MSYLKLEKKTKRGTLQKQFKLMGSVVVERRRTAVNKKTQLVRATGRMDSSHTFCSSLAAARKTYDRLVAQARAEGFRDAAPAPKAKPRRSKSA